MVCEELCKGALATPVDTFVYHNSFVPLRISTPKRVFEIKSKDTYKYNWWWAIRDLVHQNNLTNLGGCLLHRQIFGIYGDVFYNF